MVQVPQGGNFVGTGAGPIPDGSTGTPPQYGQPRVVSFVVAGLTGPVAEVSVNVTLTHSWAGDVDMVLSAPNGGQSFVLVSRIGVTAGGSFGSGSDYQGTYIFSDTATGPNIWTAAAASPIPVGTYATTLAGGIGQTNPPPMTSLNSTYGGMGAGANGTWTLAIRDAAQSDTGSVTAATLTITTGTPPSQKTPLDFDGDGKTDYAITRNSGGSTVWYIQQSETGFIGEAWGTPATDVVVPEDYDGDGKTDIAVWRAGTQAIFYILTSSAGTLQTVAFGQTGDDPRITQDFDGDGIADPAVTRNVGGAMIWYILRSNLGFTGVSFGSASTDASIRGDFDGDAKADVAVYRKTAASTFYVLRSSDGAVRAETFGNSQTDFVLPVDFDGDGRTDYAVWRGNGVGTSGTWYWLQSSDGGFRSLNFGTGNVDRPVPGDYDGDGKYDQAVWRAGSPAVFYVNGSASGFVSFPFGQTGDTPPGFTLMAR